MNPHKIIEILELRAIEQINQHSDHILIQKESVSIHTHKFTIHKSKENNMKANKILRISLLITHILWNLGLEYNIKIL